MKLDFGLSPSNLSAESKKAWPNNFGLIYSVTLGRDGLTTSIVVRNEGETAWDFQVLMHTYFRVKVSSLFYVILVEPFLVLMADRRGIRGEPGLTRRL